MRTINFGVYWTYSSDTGQGYSDCNQMYLFSPTNLTGPAPIVLDFHPGGFTSGSPEPYCDDTCEQFMNAGVHWASVGYRLTENEYFYCPDGSYNCSTTYKEAEFIHVDETGALSLDTTGLTMSDYSVVTGRYESITQCQYDAAQAMEYLIKNTVELNVDVHRVGLSGSSAGGGEINYLAWTYHNLHPTRYTPVSMTYQDAQLNYPVGETLDKAWELWEDAMGPDMLVSKVVDADQCESWLGNPECLESTPILVCNQTWHNSVVQAFCGAPQWGNITLSDVRNSPLTRWRGETVQQRGLEKLWYTSRNLAAANRTTPMYMHILNKLNGTGGMDLPHNAVYARGYAKYAKRATGVKYAVYYSDYQGIQDADVSKQRFDVSIGRSNVTLNYVSNFDLLSIPGMANVTRSQADEQFLLHCHAFNIACSV